jgi:FKBP-type peptidyl-prolyl cis-trans isomerase (trigger factor)
MQQKTEEEWRAELRNGVVDRLKRGLVLSEVARLEGLEVSHSEILEQAKLIADYSGGGEQLWRNILSSQAQQTLIATDVISNKAVERLAAIARGEAPEPGAEEEAETVEPEATEEPAPTDVDAQDVTSDDTPDETSPEPSEAEEEAREEAEEKA